LFARTAGLNPLALHQDPNPQLLLIGFLAGAFLGSRLPARIPVTKIKKRASA
jgi:uncharacterized membrane protein YfcA